MKTYFASATPKRIVLLMTAAAAGLTVSVTAARRLPEFLTVPAAAVEVSCPADWETTPAENGPLGVVCCLCAGQCQTSASECHTGCTKVTCPCPPTQE